MRLTDEHRRQRVRFGRRHRRWTRRQWANVLFSDECRFVLKRVDGRVRVWRREGEEFEEDCIQEVEPYDGGGIMCWGGISTDGKSDLLTIPGRLNARRYIDEVLEPQVVPYAAAIGQQFILMDDNATPHRARITNQFLDDQGIERLEWPSKSPDLNPIEHLWDHVKRKADKKINENTTLQQLQRIIENAWERIDQGRIRNLINSMRRRCTEVVHKQGGPTHY